MEDKDSNDTFESLMDDQKILEEESLDARSHGIWDIPVLFVFAILFATVFLQFFTRYILNDSLAWTEEAARYLLIFLAFVGATKCQLLDSHIRLEFIDHWLPARAVRALKLIALILTTGYFAFLGYALIILAQQTSFQSMVSMPFPKYYLYILIMIALAVLFIVQIRQIWQLISRNDT